MAKAVQILCATGAHGIHKPAQIFSSQLLFFPIFHVCMSATLHYTVVQGLTIHIMEI